MTVEEYALDVSKSVDEIIALCRRLKIDVKDKDDNLTEENIIELDNSIDDEEIYDKAFEKSIEIEDDMKEAVGVKKVKMKTPKKENNKDKIKEKKKAIYKSKEKLQSNKVDINDNVVLYDSSMSVKDFSDALNVSASEVISKLISLGIMANLNNSIDFENAELIAAEYNKELKRSETQDVSNFEELEIQENEEDLEKRPPVVTIMGHVDHGKTTLLDTIRKANVVEGEAGGITQHIAAYQVEHNDEKITFIDTPGHAAFTEMRARGAQITDIIIIIVAADDGVMPQTQEAIDHAKQAGVPIIVAINKIDKPNVNVDKVMEEISTAGLMPEEWGGDVIVNKISALSGEGIDELLENILLLSEMAELKANKNKYASGTIIESCLNKNVGAQTTILIQNGTLRLGDPLVAGTIFGKIRSMINDKNEEIMKAYPSEPVVITGLETCPEAGDKFMAFEDEKEARKISEKRKQKKNEESIKPKPATTLEDLFKDANGLIKEVNVIVKADVRGSAEAIKSSLEELEVEDVRVKVIRSSVGNVTEGDVVLAQASSAIIIGFNVRPNAKTKAYAKEKNVDIRLHNVIYNITDELKKAMQGLLEPEFEEKVLGEAEVRKIFKFSKVGTIAGSYVNEGIIKSNSKVRVIRDGIVIYDGEVDSVQREKETVKEVKKGFECGITIVNFNDIKEKDLIESYEIVEKQREI